MTTRHHSSSSSPAVSGIVVPLLLLAFAVAVSKDWLGAPELLQTAVDAWFGLWTWIGEQVATLTDALPDGNAT